MFRRITIEMEGPICDCAEQKLSWTPMGPGLGLRITCETCKTVLDVPHSKFVAGFKLDRAYPGRKAAEPKRPKLEVMDGGAKVIPFGPVVEPPKDAS